MGFNSAFKGLRDVCCLFSGIVTFFASTNWNSSPNFLGHCWRCHDLYL